MDNHANIFHILYIDKRIALLQKVCTQLSSGKPTFTSHIYN